MRWCNPVVACQCAFDFLVHRDCVRFLISVVESMRVVWIVGVLRRVVCRGFFVGCGHVVIGTSQYVAVSVPLPLPWFCRFVKVWSSSALCWFQLGGLRCRVHDCNVIISFTLTVQSLLLIL